MASDTTSYGREIMRCKFIKDCTMRVNVGNIRRISASEVIDAIECMSVESDPVKACVPRGLNRYEVTLSSEEIAQAVLHEGISVKDEVLESNFVSNKTKIVSILNLPYYIEDHVIENKLKRWDVQIEGHIRYPFDKNTGCPDGTRLMKVIFPPGVSSLPFSVRFQTIEGFEYFGLRHDDQDKVCFHCLSNTHLKAECPTFRCLKVNLTGHIQRKCNTSFCVACQAFSPLCECTPTIQNTNEFEANKRHRSSSSISPNTNSCKKFRDMLSDQSSSMSEDETRLSTSDSPERLPSGASHELLSPGFSPERLPSGASPERLPSRASPERLSSDVSSELVPSGAPTSNQEIPSGVPIVVLTRMNIKVKNGSEDKKTTGNIMQDGIIPEQNTDLFSHEIIEIDGIEERDAESDDNENSDVNIHNTTDSEEDDANKDDNRNRVDTSL
ncbi:hypothetical protein SNE40_013085 [Patella caerulea]|uniref:Uncharacterized protein n=1 Tax=Patella caerulea TaxID=87958 RepID=A0AAN8JIP4_PATCE